ncbi:MAG: phenylalanine--tRNA ligase subunit beta, partial [Nitriliruptorales bacterium]
TVVGEILLDPLWGPLARGELGLQTAPDLARHPAIHVDVAVVVADDVCYEAVEAAVRRGAGDLLDRLHLFDEYHGAQVGEGRRSLAFHLRLQAPDRQLTDADADQAIDAVAETVADIGGTLRRQTA